MTFHQASQSETVKALDTNPTRGLNAQQVQDRLTRFGENKLTEKHRKLSFSDFWLNSKIS